MFREVESISAVVPVAPLTCYVYNDREAEPGRPLAGVRRDAWLRTAVDVFARMIVGRRVATDRFALRNPCDRLRLAPILLHLMRNAPPDVPPQAGLEATYGGVMPLKQQYCD